MKRVVKMSTKRDFEYDQEIREFKKQEKNKRQLRNKRREQKRINEGDE